MTIVRAAAASAHVLVFPYPAQGHMIPLLDLTHHLATHGLTITILITPKNLHLLSQLSRNHPSIQTLILPFPDHPSLPAGAENVKDMPPNSFRAMMHTLSQLHQPFLEWFESHPSPPVAIISDIFLGWTHHLASKLGIRRFVFSPSGAMALSTIYYLWQNMPEEEKNDVVLLENMPSFTEYPWWQISPMYRSYVKGELVSEFIRDGFLANIASWGLVVNSFSELERVHLDYLMKELGHDRVWAVGPLLPSVDDTSTERGGPSSVLSNHITSWLDERNDRTVVVVCFGSQAVLTNDQMDAIALGLEKSGVNFIWCVKEPTEGHVAGKYGLIPKGFEDQVAGRGLVIKGWAPQVLILSHKAVGSFLTHCGWNSVIESLVACVPMLAWPMGADQFVNAKLTVEELKVAKRVCEGAHTVPDSNELARVIAKSVSENRVERERLMELQRAALEAISEGGKSVKDLEGLVKHLVGLELHPTNF